MSARAAGVVLGLAALAADARAESEILYTRVTPLEARTGVVEIRTLQEAIADVPVDCAGAEPRSLGCTSDQRFARVYGLSFALERREAREGVVHVDHEDRGQAYLFLHLDRDDLAVFDDELRVRLAGLAADAFVDVFAGLVPGAEVFSRVARWSPEPSWSCFEHGSSRQTAAYQRETAQDADGSTKIVSSGTTVYSQGPAVDPLCTAGPALVGSTPPDEIRTMPSARALREETALVGFVDRLPDVARADDLLPLPEGTAYTFRRRPGVRSSASRHTQDGKVKATFAKDEVEFGAEVEPVSFPSDIVATRGWLARWTIETIDRELGARPSETRRPPIVLRSALVATLPPTPLSAEGRPAASPPDTVEPRFDAHAYLAEIAGRLDRAASLDVDTLADAIAKDPAGLRSRGFVLFVCRERGATFELLPTGASTEVVNASELCAAIDRSLARGGVE